MRATGTFAALLAIMGWVTGCSEEVRRNTFEMRLVDDQTLHTVTLYREVVDAHNPEWVPVLTFRFPRAYYAFRDNQIYSKQSVIGLALDRETLGPISMRIAEEKDISGYNAIGKHFMKTYRGDFLLSTVRYPSNRTDTDPYYITMEELSGVTVRDCEGFTFVEQRHLQPPNPPPRLGALPCAIPEDWIGFDATRRLRAFCNATSKRCEMTFRYRGSEVVFWIPAGELRRAPAIRNGLIMTLDRHLVS